MASNPPCPHCGQFHRPGARFCPVTGKTLALTGQEQPGTSPAPPSRPAQAENGASGPAYGGLPATGLTGRLPANTLLKGRYLILKKLGQGGMAAVYLVADTFQTGMTWAVKEMSDAALTGPQEKQYAIQAFQQEARLLQSLNHPNLPKVTDFFAEGGKHYLVMEYVPGQSLEAMLASRKAPFSEEEALGWALQLCEVLSYLHNQPSPIIFRDLKPSNVMITPDGRVKLIDFGIVRFFKPGKTRDTQALGTPGYSAPEAAIGQTDARSDIYSFCVTLHQMLTNCDPVQSIFNLPPARQLNPRVSAGMERLLQRGLQHQREGRWESAAALHGELLQLREGGTTPVAGAGAAPGAPFAAGAVVVTPYSPRGQPAGGTVAAPVDRGGGTPGYPAGSAPKTSRPTQRLVLAAAQLSPRQLALLAGGTVLFLIAAAWLLTPVLEDLKVDWNTVPIFALFGALGFAAFPKRGSALVSHVVLTGALVGTVWLRLAGTHYPWENLALGLLVSGLFVELWAALLPKVKGQKGQEAWVRELAWLAAMAVGGTILFMGLTSKWKTGLEPAQWLLAAAFGAAGWFLGDLIQQYVLYRRTGLTRFKG